MVFCLSLGASHAIDYKKEDFAEKIRILTAGKGVNVIMDFVGGPYFQKNINSLALEGRLIMQGWMGGSKLSEANLAPVLRNRLKIIGSTLRSRSLEYKIALAKDLHNFAWELFEKGKLKPIIDSVYDWKEVASAHRYMEEKQECRKNNFKNKLS